MTTLKEVFKMAVKAGIKQKTVFQTTDGQQFGIRDHAEMHERGIIIRRVLAKDKTLKNNIDKSELPDLINSKLTEILEEVYVEGLLPGGYGQKQDF